MNKSTIKSLLIAAGLALGTMAAVGAIIWVIEWLWAMPFMEFAIFMVLTYVNYSIMRCYYEASEYDDDMPTHHDAYGDTDDTDDTDSH